MNCDCQ